MRPRTRSTPARPVPPKARAQHLSSQACPHPESRMLILIRPGLSFAFCMECEKGTWLSDEQGQISRPERIKPKT